MEQIKINLKKFKEHRENKLYGTYVFIASDCPLCFEMLKRLDESNKIDQIYVVDCLEDPDYYMRELGLDNMPLTIVFKDNEEVYEKEGVLYDKQIRELKEAINDSLYSTDT
jgi:hypothetical protein